MKPESHFNSRLRPGLAACLLGLGFLALASAAQAAERIVGQVTKVDVARNAIEIDGSPFGVSPKVSVKDASVTWATRSLSDVRQGQTVSIEADSGVIRTILMIKGPVPE